MTFGRESEMAQPVRDWLERQRLWVKQEFSVPWGICDFVAVSLNARRVAKRLQFGQVSAIGPLRRIALLQHIPDKETGRTITQYQLEKLCGASSELIEAELKKLIASGFVTCTRPGSLQKLNGWAPLHNRIVAVELKLARISDALVQASANRAFASESYIALPAGTALRIARGPRITAFLLAGLGILAVTKEKCKMVLRTSANGIQPDAALQMHCVERFWRTRGSSA